MLKLVDLPIGTTVCVHVGQNVQLVQTLLGTSLAYAFLMLLLIRLLLFSCNLTICSRISLTMRPHSLGFTSVHARQTLDRSNLTRYHYIQCLTKGVRHMTQLKLLGYCCEPWHHALLPPMKIVDLLIFFLILLKLIPLHLATTNIRLESTLGVAHSNVCDT